MCLFSNNSIYAYSNGTLAQAGGRAARVLRSDQLVDQFTVDAPIEWLKLSPDGKMLLIYSDRGTRIWRWREGFGLGHFLEASSSRDILGCGFTALDESIVTLVSKDHTLRGLGAEDRELFTSNLRSPHSFAPRSFIQLPGSRLALAGAFFSDPSDVVITVRLRDLLSSSDAVQRAIGDKAPVWDRAIDIAVGSCSPGAAVVLRDPEDTEQEADEDEDEDRRDVENFTGVYIRELDTGRLVERHAYTGRAGSGAAIAATPNWIVAQVVGGVDMIRRSTGKVQHVPGAVLDAGASQLAIVESGVLADVSSIDQVGLGFG
jgi:hypothetical protein